MNDIACDRSTKVAAQKKSGDEEVLRDKSNVKGEKRHKKKGMMKNIKGLGDHTKGRE